MNKELKFNQIREKNSQKLELYLPIVARVHGDAHPEFHKVHTLFEEINKKIREAGSKQADLKEEFAKLRQATDNYTVPTDVCESYEAVYTILAEMDKAYHN